MIDNCHMSLYKDLSNKLKEKSELAIIILNNSNNNTSYHMNFIKSQTPENGGIYLQIKDQNNQDLLTDGFLLEDKVISFVFDEIKKHLDIE